MTYFTNLFTVETYEAFLNSDRTISGFRETQMGMAQRVQPGDKMLAYIKGLSRWAAVLEVIVGPFVDRKPIFVESDDPFVIRFRVNPYVCLDFDHAVPILEPEIFDILSFTKGRRHGYWLGPLRRSLQHISDEDGRFLEDHLIKQNEKRRAYPVDNDTLEGLRAQRVKRADGMVDVVVPKDETIEGLDVKVDRESTKIQADLARLGSTMGFRIWLPRGDRSAVLRHWDSSDGALIDTLPLNYDDTTLRTIEQIDVIWLKGRAIQRAFEVEHTTAVYSGLLRMADLLALQPNMNIALHIVAPDARREKVLAEIRRPVFSLLENQPLSERCTFLAYESLSEILAIPHVGHMADTVLEEYEDRAD
jgi:hypothetical protein